MPILIRAAAGPGPEGPLNPGNNAQHSVVRCVAGDARGLDKLWRLPRLVSSSRMLMAEASLRRVGMLENGRGAIHCACRASVCRAPPRLMPKHWWLKTDKVVSGNDGVFG